MKRLFRIAASLLAAATIGIWVVLGTNTGWTKNRVQKIHIDEVTGIEHPIWQEKWIPGVDFLAVGLACSAALLLGSVLKRQYKPRTEPS